MSLAGVIESPCLSLGNRCGHVPAEPRFYAASPRLDGVTFPKIIQKAMNKITEFYRKPRLIPTLARTTGRTDPRRQKRSERREACIAMLGALLQYTDLETLRIGRPGDDGFNGIRMLQLAELAGLTLRRAERAYSDLVRAGLVKTHPIAEKQADGSYKGLAAIRTLSEHLFGVLGLGTWLTRERKRAYNRNRIRKPRPVQAARAGLQLAAARESLGPNASGRQHLDALKQGLSADPPD
ncbi:MAG: replication protein RepA [Gammaproteobacteria bacterium]|nr:replication protein RepA [Gammaproteobacteria bacterium]